MEAGQDNNQHKRSYFRYRQNCIKQTRFLHASNKDFRQKVEENYSEQRTFLKAKEWKTRDQGMQMDPKLF